MPMCDAYIPTGALDPDAERIPIAAVTDILVSRKVRRICDLMRDPQQVEVTTKRARSIAWTFVHRCETYVAGAAPDAPYYRFIASIPEGQLDEFFIPAVNRAIFAALKQAESGRWPDLSRRVWIFTQEIPDGTWGADGVPLTLGPIVDFVAPGWGHLASVDRWNAKPAAALVALAAAGTDAMSALRFEVSAAAIKSPDGAARTALHRDHTIREARL